jgi:hypothetical protein
VGGYSKTWVESKAEVGSCFATFLCSFSAVSLLFWAVLHSRTWGDYLGTWERSLLPWGSIKGGLSCQETHPSFTYARGSSAEFLPRISCVETHPPSEFLYRLNEFNHSGVEEIKESLSSILASAKEIG